VPAGEEVCNGAVATLICGSWAELLVVYVDFLGLLHAGA